MGKNKQYVLEHIAVANVAAEGKCVARHEDKVIFIDNVVPGDIVDIKVLKSKKKFAEAIPIRFHQYSQDRIEPVCEHFGTCGGCKWQHLAYEKQLAWKAQQVKDNLERIGKVELPELLPIIGSEKTTFYRNKLEFTFSNKRWLTQEEVSSDQEFERRALGFHIPGRFDKILDVNKCWLQAEPSNAIRNEVKAYALEHSLEFFDIYNKEGFLRNLIIRTSSAGETMVIVQVYREDQPQLELLLDHIKNKFPQITSLMYVINPKGNETFHDLEVKCWSGKPYISEYMEGLEFRIGPKSFYQTNSDQAYRLYSVTREMAGLTGNETVYDLYTGTGTIALFLARQAKKVIGVEYVEMAVQDAKQNALNNNIANVDFFAGDMKDVLTEAFAAEHGKPDVIITDPPRAGMHQDVVDTILKLAPKRIVYVSCNPATQARDLALMDAQYKVIAVRPVDMFPHTHHVENVVLLELR